MRVTPMQLGPSGVDGNDGPIGWLSGALRQLVGVANDIAPTYFYVKNGGLENDWEIVKAAGGAHGGDKEKAGAVIDGLLPEESRRAYFAAIGDRLPGFVDEFFDETLGEAWPQILLLAGAGLAGAVYLAR